MEAMDAEVLGIEEKTFTGVIVWKPVWTDLLWDSAGIFTEITGNVFEGNACIEAVFNVESILGVKVFMITGNIFTHGSSPSAAYGSRAIIKYMQK